MLKLVKLISFLFMFATFLLNLTSAERSTYIVHMDKSFMPKAFASHQHWYSSTLNSLKSTSPNSDPQKPLELLYTYDNVFHGFSAVLSRAELEAVNKLPGFVSACSDRVATLDTTRSTEFLGLNPVTGLWPAANYGKDVIVGVLDTGVWPESLSYKDDGMTDIPSRWKGSCDGGYDFNSSLCNKKLIGARYFNKGLLAANQDDRDNKYSARDTDGHGTHTSSIVAGNYVEDVSFFGYARGRARGVAPRARLAIYKVSFREGRYASDVLAGLDQAVADGVDVISISFGFNSIPFYEDPIAIASFAAMEKGVFVSTSAGNSGSTPRRLHNGIPWVLTVAAGSMDRSFGGSITLGNGLNLRGWSLFPAKAVVKDSTLVYNETIAGCNSTELLSEFHGGTIICDNSSSFSSQIHFISESNADAAIFISSDFTYDENSFQYPGAIISPDEAANVIDYATKDANPTVTIKFQQTFVGTKPAPMVAEYTRLGPSPTYPGILKPDLMAPGTLVLAAWIPDDRVSNIGSNIGLSNSDDFNLISGTSMACPHGAGIAALLKGAHPDWSPAAIRSSMVTTANPLDNTGNPIREINGFNNPIASPLSMGAGQVNPNSALDPGLIYDATAQDYMELLCSINYTRKQIRTITRSSYNCSKASSDLNYPSFVSLYTSGTNASTQNFKRIVTNVGDGAATYKAKVTPPEGSVVTVFPETLVFRKKYEKRSYSLTIHTKIDENNQVTYGAVIWVEDNGKHSVRSPIVVTPKISSDDS
ncbi:unnamed protein product [Coffea canephora]|uniref:Subtilisin-like protease SBT1.9 n=1 Tax=Coffea canephora TaxID=49390 RepID=A0A068TYI9_COFCA|nr:unnamed protein product [Coffea canephora]